MARFASLSSQDSRVRGKLQARLFYSREKNRDLRKAANAPLSFDGATIGILGSGGSLPVGWADLSSQFDLEVVALDKKDDNETITLRRFGTNSSGGAATAAIRLPIFSASENEIWTFLNICQITDETILFDGDPARLQLQSRLGSSFLSNSVKEITTSWSNQNFNHTVAATADSIWGIIFGNTVANGNSCDVTVQISNIKIKRTG